MKTLGRYAGAAAALVASGGAWGQGPAAKAPAVELIPRDVLFGNPDRGGSQLSPDGKWISYLAPVKGVMNIWVAPSGDLTKARAITDEATRGIRQYFWAFDNAHILYSQDQGGDENWKVYSVDVQTGKARDLTPFDDIKGPDGKPIMLPSGQPLRPAARVEGVSHKFPNHVLVGLNKRDPQLHDVYKVDITTGAMEMIQQNDGYAGFVGDDDFTLRLAVRQTEDGGQEILKADGKGGFEVWQKVPQADALTTSPAGFDKSGKFAYLIDSREGNTARLTRVEISTGKAEVVASDDSADADNVLAHPTERTIQAVSFEYDRTKWKVLDKAIQADLDYLKTVANGEVIIGSRTLDDAHWLVSFVMDDGPVRLYRYDRDPSKPGTAGKATFLYTNRAKLEGKPLAKMHPVVIKARDGMNLVSYLTLPVGSFKATEGTPRPSQALPMVLFVHGGPWARDSWGYNPYHQWLANRGYAVLSVNFRGSTGFGKSFVNAGDMQWAANMHNDLLDAVDWAVKNGIADKSKVAIMGGSYGGYATLAGLTFTPDVFACGVDIVGPSNLVTLLNSIPPYWAPLIEMMTSRVGDHRTEDGRKFLASRSPLTFADKITRPLLIGQGANDPRVKQAESDQIVSAMQGRNIPVTYVVFPDEGHGFQRPENSMAFNAVVETFLAQNLGGRAQPVGGDVSNSTAQILSGGESIPGLKAPAKPDATK
ncbi:acylaminoacyl-peptidase [Phycisphaerales bacterium]|nr:acylaminoacyl-peptidase [Phycisphaerales bacterium]